MARIDVLAVGLRVWRSSKARFSPTERQRLFGLTVAIGGVCGLAAVAFHLTIRAIERRAIDRAFDAPGPSWMAWVIAVPALGALLAGIALQRWPGARGSGIPQVKVAYALAGGRLRFRDSIAKFVLAGLQIGTGSSLGREGPTVQVCAGVASSMGRLVGVSARNLRLLLPVGAAAGVAAAFNAPIAAVTFTIEEVVGTLDPTMLSGVVVAAAFAAVVERSVLGTDPVLSVPAGYRLDHAESLISYAALGLAAALVSIAFCELLLRLRRRFAEQRALPRWAAPAAGGAAAGVIAVVAMLAVNSRGIDGGGYDVLARALSGQVAVRVALALGALKLLATVCSYGSGGSGGLFAPSLFVGAMLGSAVGAVDVAVFDHARAQIGAFALVGMGAVFAGTIRAPITSILIIIEMTDGYSLALPLMITNMTAYALARRYQPRPIYEALLAQDGIDLHRRPPAEPDGPTVADIPRFDGPLIQFAPGDDSADLLTRAAAPGRQEIFPVLDGEARMIGMITLSDLTALAAEPPLGGLVRAIDLTRPATPVRDGDSAGQALQRMAEAGVHQLPVVDGEQRVIGVIDEVAIAHVYLAARRGSP